MSGDFDAAHPLVSDVNRVFAFVDCAREAYSGAARKSWETDFKQRLKEDLSKHASLSHSLVSSKAAAGKGQRLVLNAALDRLPFTAQTWAHVWCEKDASRSLAWERVPLVCDEFPSAKELFDFKTVAGFVLGLLGMLPKHTLRRSHWGLINFLQR